MCCTGHSGIQNSMAAGVPWRKDTYYMPDLLVHTHSTHEGRMVEFIQDLADRLNVPIETPYTSGERASCVIAVRFKGDEVSKSRLSRDGAGSSFTMDSSGTIHVRSGCEYPTPLDKLREWFVGKLEEDPSVGAAFLGTMPVDDVSKDCQQAMDLVAALALRVHTGCGAVSNKMPMPGAAAAAAAAEPAQSLSSSSATTASTTAAAEAVAMAGIDEAAADDGDARPVVVTRVQAWPRDIGDGLLSVLLEQLPSPWRAGLLQRGEPLVASADNTRLSRELPRHDLASFTCLRPTSAAPVRLYICRHSFTALCGVTYHSKSRKWFVGACSPLRFIGHNAARRTARRPAGVLEPVCGAFWKLREALARAGLLENGKSGLAPQDAAAGVGSDSASATSIAAASTPEASSGVSTGIDIDGPFSAALGVPRVAALRLAVDAGAAPGGWSQCLVEDAGCRRVLAVDPGALSAALPRGIEHRRTRIEAALATIAAEEGVGSVDAWVSDMNIRPAEAMIQLLAASASGILAPGAIVVVTLKRFVSAKTFAVEDVPLAVRGAAACCHPSSLKVRRLFTNKTESTLFGVAIGPEAAAAAAEELARYRADVAAAVAARRALVAEGKAARAAATCKRAAPAAAVAAEEASVAAVTAGSGSLSESKRAKPRK